MGLLEPKRFIPAAQDTGFITVIDEYVLTTACAQLSEWLRAGLPAVCITVNLSAREFQNPDLLGKITRILESTGLQPGCLDVEITESLAMRNVDHTIIRLTELADMGVHTSIDDFGTGYSSLNYLKRLPIQKLKIDQSFIQDIATNSDDRAIIVAVTAMAHNMRMNVIAEGVETEEQFSFLQSIGCDEAQGYLFSKALPAQQCGELLARGA
jgi:EAL domain-containing protein (putative c-di-GMP-specific phosphodiesterase class I)